MKGFQERMQFQSDSPTASREIFKLFCSISTNEGWMVEGSDVRSAFLQSEDLDQTIFVKPPTEVAKVGYIWRLKKPVYGLNDASRKWFQSTFATLTSLGMKQSMGDNCLFYFRRNNKLEGLLIIHVDDYLSAGTEYFKRNITSKLRKRYKFGKVLTTDFEYTGLHIRQDPDTFSIEVNQDEFIKNIAEHQYKKGEEEEELNKDENRLIRKSTGQLNWASSQTRPDLSFESFSLSTSLNKAKLKHTKQANKVISQAKKRKLKLVFQRLGNFENLHFELFADASLGNVEENLHTKSMMGYFI